MRLWCVEQILGVLAQVTVCQLFHNPGEVPVNCEYALPMDSYATVNHVRITANDRVLESRVVETSDSPSPARDSYSDDLSSNGADDQMDEAILQRNSFHATGRRSETGDHAAYRTISCVFILCLCCVTVLQSEVSTVIQRSRLPCRTSRSCRPTSWIAPRD